MSVLDRIASALGERSGGPNKALARELARSKDSAAIDELAAAASRQRPPRVASDCLEVLEEIGKIDSGLIAGHARVFLDLLGSRNNRLVWGAMTALSAVAREKAALVERELDVVLRARETGSVITVDNAISVLAHVAAARKTPRARIEGVLLSHLRTCRVKEVPQHAERSLPAVSAANGARFAKVLRARLGEMTDSQKRRVTAVLRRIEAAGRAGSGRAHG